VPIRWRLTLFIALVVGAILLVLGLALYFLSRDVLLRSVETTARTRATAAAKVIESGSGLSDAYKQQLTLDGVVMIVRDRDGGILQQVSLPEEGGDNSDVWRGSINSGEPASGTLTFTGDDPYYVYAVPLNQRAGQARVVEAAKSYEPAQHALEIFETVLIAGTATAFLLSFGGAYFLAGAALRPVDAVTKAARQMGEGDLSKRLPVANPNDEVGRLATTINGLLSRLEAAFARREETLSRQRRFAADASHELRTPLTSISGHARMLDEWALEGDRDTARRSVRAIRREAGRMRALLESLLTLTRGDERAPLDVGRHDLGKVAKEVVETARDNAGDKLSVELVCPEKEIVATVDRERILQVASILLDNAVKYTPNGGSVAVRVSEREERLELAVSDTGVGIPQDQLPLVFERFHRTNAARSEDGAGLGLSIARQIAEAHGGTIEVTSKVDAGSEFVLVLPRRMPRPEATDDTG
jgi:two-component system OmpR family sensor kinase